jgi:hypothetical protein
MYENAETSAWGRALAALGFEVQKAVASREEVENAKRREASLKGGAKDAKKFEAEAEHREEQMALFKTIQELQSKLGIETTDQKKEHMKAAGINKTAKNMATEDLKQCVSYLEGLATNGLTVEEPVAEAEAEGEE